MLMFSSVALGDQKRLAKLGFYRGDLDGKWGRLSRAALDQFNGTKKNHILVERLKSSKNATLSKLYLNGQYICDVLEDGYHEKKIYGRTRIPSGTYTVGVRKVGGFHNRYLRRFGGHFHKGMLHIQDVQGFKYILLHIGNWITDTKGCLLVGVDNNDRVFDVIKSKVTYLMFYQKVIKAALNNELAITIQDLDR